MRITGIDVYQVDLPLHEGNYSWSGGKSVTVFDSTVVRVRTDSGIEGFGEITPLGPVYLPSYAAGARAGIAELSPALIGQDPRDLMVLNRVMDASLKGHPYVKSAIDMACWDILGKSCGEPICTLLGGRCGEDFVLYRAISQNDPDVMAREKNEIKRYAQSIGYTADEVNQIYDSRAVLALRSGMKASGLTSKGAGKLKPIREAIRPVNPGSAAQQPRQHTTVSKAKMQAAVCMKHW